MVFLCWVVCVCLSVSAWPGCLSLPLDAGQQQPTLDDPNTASKTTHRAQHHSNTIVLPNDYETLIPLLRLPQDPHSIALGPVGDSQEVFRELSSGADIGADSSSARLLEALQQQGLSGPSDTTGADLSYEVAADPRLMALLDDLMTQQQQQQQRRSQVASVKLDNLTFKISRPKTTAGETYQIKMYQIPSTYSNKNHEVTDRSTSTTVGTVKGITFQNGSPVEVGDHAYDRFIDNAAIDKPEYIFTVSTQLNLIDTRMLQEPISNSKRIIAGRSNRVIAGRGNQLIAGRSNQVIAGRSNRVKRSSTTLSIDYSLKILRDTLLQELKRKKQQRVLLRKLRENQEQLLNIG